MKNSLFLVLGLALITSCNQTTKENQEELKMKMLDKVKTELVKTFTNPSVSEDSLGNVFIFQDEKSVTLNTDFFFIGQIDDDNEEDVAYSVFVSEGGNTGANYGFVAVSSYPNEMTLNLENNSKIIGILDKRVIVEVSEYAEGDPSCCPSIHKQKKYAFIGNKMVEVN